MAALALIVMLGSSIKSPLSAQPEYDEYGGGGDVSYQTFYDELSPHGRWIDYPQHGYVWVPNGIRDFRPYETGGHWVWTDGYEWMWVSDYSWGWAPFHYGRWLHDPFYGWVWVPGYEWAPAWVAWRDGGDYYGWAPLRPGISISIGFGSYNPPVDYWCFAPRRYITSRNIGRHYIDRSRNVTIINNTTIINNYSRRNNVFVNGPRRIDAERYAGRINPVRLRESNRPGATRFRNNEVSVYRPRVQNDNSRRFSPRQVDRYERNDQNGNTAGRRDNTIRNRGNENNLPTRNGRFEQRGGNNEARPAEGNSNGNSRRFERRSANQPRAGEAPGGNRERGEVRQRSTTQERIQERNNRFQQRRQEASPGGNRNTNRAFERREQRTEPRVQPQQRQMNQRRESPRAERQQSPRFERQAAPQRQAERGNNSGGNRERPSGGSGRFRKN